jgi:hypothetical protein
MSILKVFIFFMYVYILVCSRDILINKEEFLWVKAKSFLYILHLCGSAV